MVCFSYMGSQYLSTAGLEELRKELDELKNKKRLEIAERLKTAKDYGDLSENAEYSEARDEQAKVEGRIAELEDLLKNAVTIQNSGKSDAVVVGSRVTTKKGGKILVYSIVGTYEANPVEGKISDESPLGKMFLNHKVGETVTVMTPAGAQKYEIVNIE
jgi:transcription elongation factor GreA